MSNSNLFIKTEDLLRPIASTTTSSMNVPPFFDVVFEFGDEPFYIGFWDVIQSRDRMSHRSVGSSIGKRGGPTSVGAVSSFVPYDQPFQGGLNQHHRTAKSFAVET